MNTSGTGVMKLKKKFRKKQQNIFKIKNIKNVQRLSN